MREHRGVHQADHVVHEAEVHGGEAEYVDGERAYHAHAHHAGPRYEVEHVRLKRREEGGDDVPGIECVQETIAEKFVEVAVELKAGLGSGSRERIKPEERRKENNNNNNKKTDRQIDR